MSSTTRLRAAAVAGAVLVLAACAPAGPPAQPSPASGPLWGHAHGIYASQDGAEVLVATHEGLFDYSAAKPALIGQANDYMGFTGDGTALYASGHPGPASGQPNPLGLVRSTDGGKTWQALSRQGESDFHALALAQGGVVGFDGRLRTTRDLKAWADESAQVQAFALAGRPDTPVMLATTPAGVQRSTDAGHTWARVPGAPLLQFAALASPAAAAGIAPDGTVHTSTDAGLTWAAAGKVAGTVQAMTATAAGGALRVWAVTEAGVQLSADGGKTFAPYHGKG
jgi:hypothetical protein